MAFSYARDQKMVARFWHDAEQRDASALLCNMALPTTHRLINDKVFRQVFNNGKTLRGSFLLVKFVSNQELGPRIGIIVSNKVAGGAVVRNRIRRVVSDTMQSILPKLGRYDMVIRVIQDVGNEHLRQDLLKLISPLFI